MKVNGKIISITKSQTLIDFLKDNNYEITKVAVELNGNIIPKSKFKDITIQNCDSLEIVTFVGGG
ncbi:MAG: sulfur carrier protein ThiS [Endomicrobiaceae bacterium]|jgi:thiamine biosynthesis protein ThiS|nr:sulfur carrier protein ThiS [Endomicrobiaceae bacterium]